MILPIVVLKEQTCKLFDFGASPGEECSPQRPSVAVGANALQGAMGEGDKSDPLQIAEKKGGGKMLSKKLLLTGTRCVGS